MSEIRTIQTEYNGYKFRSRLEARWAVFFDEAGIDYQYEPEGFYLSDGSKYLPDFYLPDFLVYVEIKPTSISCQDREIAKNKLWELSQCDNRDFACLYCEGDPFECQMEISTTAYDSEKEEPESLPGWYQARFLKNVIVSYPPLPFNFPQSIESHIMYELIRYRIAIGVGPIVGTLEDRDWKWDFVQGKNLVPSSNISFLFSTALSTLESERIKARQARFEYGETPKPRRRE